MTCGLILVLILTRTRTLMLTSGSQAGPDSDTVQA